ncbi:hypothetical protein CGK00_24050 [Vibrio parahaemolyticus]|nr:hypothetical protein CGK00_24050 [Vibrio parahaemolyticus]
MRCSHLNRALVANEENVAKAEFLGLILVCFWLGFIFQFLTFGLVKIALRLFLGLGLLFQKPIYLLKVSFVALFLQKVFLVLLVRFLRRCVFQVVSATNALKLRLI